MTVTTDPANLEALRAAGQEFADRLADLVPAATELVRIEGALRIAETQAGQASSGPPARELAVEMLYGRLGCLRPYLAGRVLVGHCRCDFFQAISSPHHFGRVSGTGMMSGSLFPATTRSPSPWARIFAIHGTSPRFHQPARFGLYWRGTVMFRSVSLMRFGFGANLTAT